MDREYLLIRVLGVNVIAKTTVRVNINISSELHEYYKEQAERAGVSMSAAMSFALLEYKDRRISEKGTINQKG